MSVLEALEDTNLLSGVEEAQKETEEEVKKEETNEETKEELQEVTKEEAVVEKPEEKETEEVVNTPEKLKVDYLEFLKNHKSTIEAYETEKSADYSKMSPEEVLKKSFKLKYPGLSEEDIQEELSERYGVGVDTEDLDSEELVAFKAKQRKMKIDATDSIKDLEAYRDGLTLPEFEIDLPAVEKQETVNLESFLEEQKTKQLEVEKEWREKEWTPAIKQSANSLDKITHTVNLEGLGEISVDVDLSAEDKENVTKYLSDWIYHPEDQKFVDKDGNPDISGFVQERSSIVLLNKIVEKVATAAVAKAKEVHFKKEVINFTQDTKRADIATHQDESEFSLVDSLRK